MKVEYYGHRQFIRWNDAMTDDCFRLIYDVGLSARMVAEELSKKYKASITRNMVLGRVHRVINAKEKTHGRQV
jgi:hypothetical protein